MNATEQGELNRVAAEVASLQAKCERLEGMVAAYNSLLVPSDGWTSYPGTDPTPGRKLVYALSAYKGVGKIVATAEWDILGGWSTTDLIELATIEAFRDPPAAPGVFLVPDGNTSIEQQARAWREVWAFAKENGLLRHLCLSGNRVVSWMQSVLERVS